MTTGVSDNSNENVDISRKRKTVDIDVGHLTRICAEGVILLGPHPPFTMKLYPLVTMSARLQEMACSDGFGERNFTLELPACPGDHSAFKLVETFSYGFANPEGEIITNAAKLVRVCDFLDLESLRARTLKILEKHVQSSLENCLGTFATFDYDVDSCQTNKSYDICWKSLLEHVIAAEDDKHMALTMESLFRIYIAPFSPKMTDMLLDIIACYCEAKGIVTLTLAQDLKVDSLRDKNLWFRKLSILGELDYTKIPTEALGNSLDAVQTSCPSVFNFVMQEMIGKEQQISFKLREVQKELTISRAQYNSANHELEKVKEDLASATNQMIGKEEQISSKLREVQKELTISRAQYNSAKHELEKVKEDLASATNQLNFQRADLKKTTKDPAKATEKAILPSAKDSHYWSSEMYAALMIDKIEFIDTEF